MTNKSAHQKVIWTIGHSTHSLGDFIDMLQSFQIEMLADIRSFPGSRRYPHFNKEALKISLAESKIQYVHLPLLGGRRKPNDNSINTGWSNAGFRGYADYMQSEDFIIGIEQLEELASKSRTAYMCAEALWWRCHRSLVSDYLKSHGWKVFHIEGKNKAIEHPYTSVAKIVQGQLSYEH